MLRFVFVPIASEADANSIMLKLGIIGTGRLGSFHADKAAAHPDVKLVAVSDPLESSRKALAAKHKVADCATLDELFPLVDAVVIAAPTFAHYELGVRCLRQGLHVLMEKPMCASLFEAEQLVDAAQKANVVFQVGHVEEFNPAWTAAEPMLEKIRSGQPVLIDAVRSSGYTFRSTDVGTVFDMMIHDLDLVLSIIPSRVQSIEAVGFNVIGGPHEDIADTQIRFENGSVAHFFSSRVAPQSVRTMRLTTADTTTTIDFGSRTTTFLRPDAEVLQKTFAPDRVSFEEAGKFAPTFMKEHFTTVEIPNAAVDALALEMNDFVRSIQTGDTPKVSGQRALAAITVAESIVKMMPDNG
jgi:predicted dehydrogenase